MAEDSKAEIFTDRREFLLATTGDKRKAWKAKLFNPSGDTIGLYYGLANTEHQFHQAVVHKACVSTRLTRDELHAEMREELAKGTE